MVIRVSRSQWQVEFCCKKLYLTIGKTVDLILDWNSFKPMYQLKAGEVWLGRCPYCDSSIINYLTLSNGKTVKKEVI